MAMQYKPTKQKKQKPAKAPKAPKAEKPMKIGAVKAIKFNQNKKPTEPKIPRAPKPQKAKPMSFGTPTKVGNTGKPKKPLTLKPLLIILISILVVTLITVGVVMLLGKEKGGIETKSLTITSLPKTEFYVDDNPSYAGLKMLVTMGNGLTYTVDHTKCSFSGFDSSAPADHQKITVTYNGMSVEYYITIKESSANQDDLGSFDSLSIKQMPKTQFKVGDWPSVEGGVLLLQYDNGTKEIEMSTSHIYGFNTSAPGTYTVTVKYMVEEENYLAITTYEITVTE